MADDVRRRVRPPRPDERSRPWTAQLWVPRQRRGAAALDQRPMRQPTGDPGRTGARAWVLALLVYAGVRGLGLLALVVGGHLGGESAHRALVGWDAGWYRGIAAHGYGFTRAVPDGRVLTDYAFFPLYPALERLVADVTGLRIVDAGLLVSAVASLAAAAGIFAVTARTLDARAGVVVVALWAATPISVVQSMAYTESLFTALCAWALYAVLCMRYVAAGVLAALAGLTRPTGAAVAVAVMAAVALHLRSGRSPDEARPRRSLAGPLVGAALAPLGIVAFVAYVGVRERDVFGYFSVAGRWGNGLDGGAALASWVVGLLLSPDVLAGLLVSAALVLLGYVVLRLIRDEYPLPLLVFTVLSVLLALTTSGYFGSRPRYLLPVFPLLMPAGAWLAGRRTATIVAGLAALAVLSGCYGAVWLSGSGPP